MVKKGDKLPAEFRTEWLERNRELRKTANKLIASVVADGKVLGDEPMFDGVAALYFPAEKEARDSAEKSQGKDSLSLVMDEGKVLFERTGAQFKNLGQLKVILTSIKKKELSAAQFKDLSLKGYAKADSKSLMESGIQKIVASFAVPAKDKPSPFDVMLEIYFNEKDDVKATFGSPVIGILRKDEETLVDITAPEIRIVAEEHTL
ncbi:MAG: EthD domain-containing protein [Betaproteobacteria bacterium]|nr:EthD domain-containing protein [Betaproteobacteria bacterium]